VAASVGASSLPLGRADVAAKTDFFSRQWAALSMAPGLHQIELSIDEQIAATVGTDVPHSYGLESLSFVRWHGQSSAMPARASMVVRT
jgi:hypothetical protein